MYRPIEALKKKSDAFSGRTLIAEMWTVDDEARDLGNRADAGLRDFYRLAIQKWMKPLVVAGLERALQGVTTLSELRANVFTVGEFRQREDLVLKFLVDWRATYGDSPRAVANG